MFATTVHIRMISGPDRLQLERAFRVLVWCGLLLAAACRSQAPLDEGGLVQGGASGAAGGGGQGGGSASAQGPRLDAGVVPNAGDGEYRVEVRADETTLCPGQCTTLRTEISNGTAPFRYAWAQTELSGEGPFEICPTQTTAYEVSVTDAFSTLEEFGGEDREATGALQIVVTDACERSDGGVAQPIAALPGQPICELRVATNSTSSFSPNFSWGALSNMNVDAHGNLYFVATMSGGTIQIGELSIEGGGDHVDGVVVKLSPDCEPLWAKPLRTLTGSLAMRSLAVSPSGDDIYVTGVLEGSAELGGETIDVAGNDTGLVMRLDANGEVLWVEAVTATYSLMNDVAIADNGDVVVTGFALDGGSFAGLSLGTESNSYTSFVARLRSNGDAVFLHATPQSTEDLSVTLLPSGAIALMGSGFRVAPLELAGGVIDGTSQGWGVFVAVLEPAGDFIWGRTVRSGGDSGWTSFVSTTMAHDRAGNLLIDESHYVLPPDGTVISTPPELIRIDENGDELWSRERPYLRTSINMWSGGIAINSQDHVLVLDEVIAGETDENGDILETAGASDFMLSKRSADGDPIWRWQSGTPQQDWCWGLTVDAQDAIWIGSGASGEIVVTRLAP